MTLIFSMIVVIPKFQQVFSSMGQALPLPTRMLIAISNAITHYGWAMAIAVVLAAIMVRRAVNTPKGRFWWDGMKIRIPLIKGIVACSIYANFSRTLATLLSNGVPLLQALGIVEKVVSNTVIAKEIKNARERVTDGTSISGPLSAGKIFPPMMIDMLSIGEQTGDMEGALNHIARRYESELSRNIKIFTTALEPILIVIIAVMVGFVAVSVLMAVFSMTNGLDV
jgi:type IV pilus assembly protein PilC